MRIVSMSPRRGLVHKTLRPFHQIRRHPRAPGMVYCRTCYVVRGVSEIRRKRKAGIR